MSYQREIEKYIGQNKGLIAKLMGLSPKEVSTSDLRIFANFLSYRAGESHFLDNGGKIDPRFIDDIRLKSRKLKGPKALLDAIAWYERGVLSRGSLATAFKEDKQFSPKIERYLQKKREENYKRAFENMGSSVNALRKTVSELAILFAQEDFKRSLQDKDYVKSLKKKMTQLRGDLARCDYHARAGIAWAVKVGIPFDHAKAGIHQVYLRHLKESKLNNEQDQKRPGTTGKTGDNEKGSKPLSLGSTLALIDETLKSQNIKSSISKNIRDRSEKWDADLLMAKANLLSQGKSVSRQQEKVLDQSQVPTLTASI